MGTNHSIKNPVIFFDGVCNLCNSSVQFILKKEGKEKFLFSALQSAYARQNLATHLSDINSPESIVLKEGDKITTKSTAALSILRKLSGLWPLLYAFIIIPKFFRDWIYDVVVRNRYKWLGKKDQCMIPSPELKNRFID